VGKLLEERRGRPLATAKTCISSACSRRTRLPRRARPALLTTRFEDILADPTSRSSSNSSAGGVPRFPAPRPAAGKNVVTANKQLLAQQRRAVRGREASGAHLRFEASAVGAVPSSSTARVTRAAEVKTIFGIVNGTTNYMLSAMPRRRRLRRRLKEAQRWLRRGRPTGTWAARIGRQDAILSSIAFHSRTGCDVEYEASRRHWPWTSPTACASAGGQAARRRQAHRRRITSACNRPSSAGHPLAG